MPTIVDRSCAGRLLDQALVDQIVQQFPEFGRTLLGTDVIFLDEQVAQLSECPRAIEAAPDGCRDLVESVAIAAVDIERDERLADVRLHELHRPAIDWTRHSAPSEIW